MWLVRRGLLLDLVYLYCPHEIEITIRRREGRRPSTTRVSEVQRLASPCKTQNKATGTLEETLRIYLNIPAYCRGLVVPECTCSIFAYEDFRKTLEMGLCLTCHSYWMSSDSPNEWGSWEILPFITLSLVTQHSEHFPKTQVHTSA